MTFSFRMSAIEYSYDRYSPSKIIILILSDGVKIQIYKLKTETKKNWRSIISILRKEYSAVEIF